MIAEVEIYWTGEFRSAEERSDCPLWEFWSDECNAEDDAF